MASRVVEVIYRIRDEASATLGRVQAASAKLSQTLRTQLGSGGALAALGAAAAGAAYSVRGMLAAFNEAQVASAKLAQALRNSGDTSDRTRGALDQQSASLQKLTGISDEAVTTTQAMLLNMGLTADQTMRAIPGLVDMAAATGRLSGEQADLSSVAMAVVRSVNGGGEALRRYGVFLSTAEQNAFKAANQSGRLTIVLGAIQRQAGGAGEAIGQTFSGAVAKASGAVNNLQEQAGALIASALTPLVSLVARAVNWFLELPAPVRLTAVAFGLMAGAVVTLAPVIALAGPALMAVAAAAGAIVVAIGPWVVGFTALAAVTFAVYASHKNLLAAVVALAGAVGAMASGNVSAATRAWEDFKKAGVGAFDDIIAKAKELSSQLLTPAAPVGGKADSAAGTGAADSGAVQARLDEINRLAQLEAINNETRLALQKQLNDAMTQADLEATDARIAEVNAKVVNGYADQARQLLGNHQITSAQFYAIDKALASARTATDLAVVKYQMDLAKKDFENEKAIAGAIVQVETAAGNKILEIAQEVADGSTASAKEYLGQFVISVGRAAAAAIMAYYATGAAQEVATKGLAGLVTGGILLAKGVAAAAAVTLATGLVGKALTGENKKESGAAAPKLPEPTGLDVGPPGPADFAAFSSASAGGGGGGGGGGFAGGAPMAAAGPSYTINVQVPAGTDADMARRIASSVRNEIALLDAS